jgi:alkanesulfonate monooxygenase SsuD/methylene tetrahydromethanopterin reductase-like flavin-dependent oxidoreductase (luciferase family)
MENHGTEFKTRFALLRERVLAMKEIWTKEGAEYHGRFVNFDPLWSHPKPVQKPHPPILMGGDGPKTFDRVIEFCDGWMPIGYRMESLPEKISELRRRAEAAGRDPQTISITIFGAKPEREALDQLEAAGVERVIFMLPAADRNTVMPLVDKFTGLIR